LSTYTVRTEYIIETIIDITLLVTGTIFRIELYNLFVSIIIEILLIQEHKFLCEINKSRGRNLCRIRIRDPHQE
jgi:hypothetical protein